MKRKWINMLMIFLVELSFLDLILEIPYFNHEKFNNQMDLFMDVMSAGIDQLQYDKIDTINIVSKEYFKNKNMIM